MRESSFPSRFFRSRFRSSVSRQLTEVPEVYNHRMIRRKLIKGRAPSRSATFSGEDVAWADRINN